VLKKLEKVDELLVQVWRIVNALERIAGIRLKTPEDNIIFWPESRGEETETMKRIDKGKDKEVGEKKCDNEQSKMNIEDEGDGIEEVKKTIGTLVSSVWSNRVEKNLKFKIL